MDAETPNIKKWVIFYPVYSKACENPIWIEIADCCQYLKIRHAVEYAERGVGVLLKTEMGLWPFQPFLRELWTRYSVRVIHTKTPLRCSWKFGDYLWSSSISFRHVERFLLMECKAPCDRETYGRREISVSNMGVDLSSPTGK